MRIALLLACLSLTGCAASVISSTERTVIIHVGFGDVGKAQALASEECKARGLYAKLTGKLSGTQYVFDCVP